MEPLPKQGCEQQHQDQGVQGLVSVEPLPKQGCEKKWAEERESTKSLSGTPAEAGVRESWAADHYRAIHRSQWNPCRSRGASWKVAAHEGGRRGLSGTPAEAGVRGAKVMRKGVRRASLSGTPAEAGVRGD